MSGGLSTLERVKQGLYRLAGYVHSRLRAINFDNHITIIDIPYCAVVYWATAGGIEAVAARIIPLRRDQRIGYRR
jgi:hypothetical protein